MLIILNVVLFVAIYAGLYFSLRNTILGTFATFSYIFFPFEIVEIIRLKKEE